jgi:hypothetical protein
VNGIHILLPVIRPTQIIDIREKKFEFQSELRILVTAAFRYGDFASENDGVVQFCLLFAVADQKCL